MTVGVSGPWQVAAVVSSDITAHDSVIITSLHSFSGVFPRDRKRNQSRSLPQRRDKCFLSRVDSMSQYLPLGLPPTQTLASSLEEVR